MKKLLAPLLIVITLFICSGCASITRGTKDTLVVESDPPGAQVRLSTGQVGSTPTSFKLPRKAALTVYIEKAGYEPISVQVNSQISGAGAVGVAGNVLVGGIIGLGVDAISGASKDLKPNPISVRMVPLQKPENNTTPELRAAPIGETVSDPNLNHEGKIPDPTVG